MKLRIRETYLIFLIVIGLVSLSLYTTYAMFTATTTIEDVVDFDTSLSLNTSLSEYELITLTGNEMQVIEVNVTNSYDSTLCYGIWYEVVSGDSSSLDIGTFTEKNTTLPSGQITSGSTITAVVGMSNGSSSSITLKLGTIGRETSGSSCSLGITSPRSLIGTEWADVILVTDEYLSEHTTTTSNDYSWSSNTSGSTTLTLNPGEYLLQVWGAQGGTYITYATGGKGGYSYGTLTLSDTTTVYAHVGGQGSYYATTTYTSKGSGGSNGGGNAAYRGGTGGGASDIRIGTDSLYARVIVAGGGGGAYAYDSTYYADGGTGGGTTGGNGSYYSYSTDSTYRGYGGTQTAGGASGTALTSGNYNGSAGSFGVGGDTGYKYAGSSYYSNGAGGGGWYGGGAADNYEGSSRNYASGGGGGSGYVYTSSTASNYPSGCLLNSSHYLTDAATVAGSTSFTDYDGTTVKGHSGDGAIKITGTEQVSTYSIPTLSGLTTLKVALGASADYTTDVEVVCANGTTGCSILEYPTLDTSTLEVGAYTVYYVVKGSDNKKYKYARIINIISCNQSTTINFEYTGDVQTYILTCPGEYKLEVWGAQGSKSGGKGGYSYGNLDINDETLLYVYVGDTSGFNGGGTGGGHSARTNSGITSISGYDGGGATDIRIGSSLLYSRVIVAGGGGGSTSTCSGGAGGGTSGIEGVTGTSAGRYDGDPGGGGTINSGGTGGAINKTTSSTSGDPTNRTYGSTSSAGGGGGWYGGGGGGGASCNSYGFNGKSGSGGSFGIGGTGGAAHIINIYDGGYKGGCGGGGSGYVYTSSTASSYPTGCLLNSSYYLTDAATIAGDQSFTDYDGTTVTGHSGNGYARITYLG